MRIETSMFYVYELPRANVDQAITVAGRQAGEALSSGEFVDVSDRAEGDIDFVDDALLNTSPHNVIEKQLLRGDVVGLALMSGAIIWSAMGAFG
jgi:hypothetical protein